MEVKLRIPFALAIEAKVDRDIFYVIEAMPMFYVNFCVHCVKEDEYHFTMIPSDARSKDLQNALFREIRGDRTWG